MPVTWLTLLAIALVLAALAARTRLMLAGRVVLLVLACAFFYLAWLSGQP